MFKRIGETILNKEFFTDKKWFMIVIFIFLIFFVCFQAWFADSILDNYAKYLISEGVDQEKVKDISFLDLEFTKSILGSAFSTFIILIGVLLFHIKKLYQVDPFESEINATMKTFLISLFGSDNNKILMANHYKLNTFLDVIDKDNDRFIIFGKLEREVYWGIYQQFCGLADHVLWTKTTSFLNEKELKNILKEYGLKLGDNNLYDLIQNIDKELLTSYDKEFLKTSGEKSRILVVKNLTTNLLNNEIQWDYGGFLKLINTDKEVCSQLNSATKVKRIENFIGNSKLYLIDEDEFSGQFNIDKLEFGVYAIDDILYTIKTEEVKNKRAKTVWHVSIEAETAATPENVCNQFFDTFQNQDIKTYSINGTGCQVNIISKKRKENLNEK